MTLPRPAARRRELLLGAAAAGLALGLPRGALGQTPDLGAGLPRRGVNLSHWLSWEGRQPVGPGDARLC